MIGQRDESEERTVRRIEAFSDIVIGFSLAQLGVSLTIPARGTDLFSNPAWLVSFLWAFALICALWWFHHRIFASIFVPRTIPVLLNFVWLAVVVLCVYATQITVHLPFDPVSWRMYFVLFALAYGLLAVQYYVGVRVRGAVLAAHVRLAAQRQATFMSLWAVAFAISSLAMFMLPWGAPVGLSIWATMITASIVSGFLGRHYRKLEKKIATRS